MSEIKFIPWYAKAKKKESKPKFIPEYQMYETSIEIPVRCRKRQANRLTPIIFIV